jgi:methionyl-tRNA formyltransferase
MEKKVLLLGMGPTSLSALESLVARFNVVGIVRDAGAAAGEGDEVIARARALRVPVFADASAEGVEQAIIETGPACTVVSSYNRILRASVLDRCKFLNVHYAPLPRYRGRANVNWAIINGEAEAAITIHVLAQGLDSGNILYQQLIPIGPDDTVEDLYTALNEIQREVLGDTVLRYLSGYAGEPQEESAATYGCGRVPGDGEIDWSAPTKRIYALLRALAPPYPRAFTYLEGRQISIIRATPLKNAPEYAGRIPGRVIGRSRQSGYADVLTGDGVLRIYEMMAGDGAVAPASAFIESTRQTLGLHSADLLARIEELQARLDQLAGPAAGS